MSEGKEGSIEPEEMEWSFADFLGAGRSRETIQDLVGRILAFEDTHSLQQKLEISGLEPEDLDELRSDLAERRRKGESDEFCRARRRAADRLVTARGKMAWHPGERDQEDTRIRTGSSLSARLRVARRGEKARPPETESGDEFGGTTD